LGWIFDVEALWKQRSPRSPSNRVTDLFETCVLAGMVSTAGSPGGTLIAGYSVQSMASNSSKRAWALHQARSKEELEH
jgi:hypothetical protein